MPRIDASHVDYGLTVPQRFLKSFAISSHDNAWLAGHGAAEGCRKDWFVWCFATQEGAVHEQAIVMDLSADSYLDVAVESSFDQGTTDYSEWQDVDRQLRSIARRQSGLDAELMRALREAERVRLWRHLGCASMMEYLERVFGFGPRAAQDRLRTARRLEELTDLADALELGELPFSAVRELTRVATGQTQAVWRAAVRGKCLREIEEMVSGLEPGDLPGERKRPELMRVRLSYEEIDTSTQALERQVRHMLDTECGERLDDNAFLAAVFQLALGAPSGDQGVGDRAKFQIVHYHCDTCGAAAQLGGGVKLPVGESEADRAECDAEHVSLDAPARPTQDIPKKVRRFVELRDAKRCRIPGCRSARNLELHHIVHREDGGTHDPLNLIVLCGGHHGAHHEGRLWIDGTAVALQVQRFEPGDARRATDYNGDGSRSYRDSSGASAVDGSGEHDNDDASDRDSTRNDYIDSAPSVSCADSRGLSRAHVGVSVPARSKSTRYADAEIRTNAISALMNTGWLRKASAAAVDSAMATLGGEAELLAVIKTALQRCVSGP